MDNSIRLAGIAYESLVNGPGMRRVFFTQGCRHNCEGCFNPETHDFSEGYLWNMEELIEGVKKNPLLKGITFSGGDPFEQGDKVAYMASCFKSMGLNVWSYTGYTYEYIMEHMNEHEGWKELMESLDVLVDGTFQQALKQEGLRYRGSLNQRIIDVQKSRELGRVVTLEY